MNARKWMEYLILYDESINLSGSRSYYYLLFKAVWSNCYNLFSFIFNVWSGVLFLWYCPRLMVPQFFRYLRLTNKFVYLIWCRIGMMMSDATWIFKLYCCGQFYLWRKS